ncbi:MAG: ATP-dependent zinc protease [Pseudomonas sp.]|nr:ATP-dependent zinc protease [Pseudomonas sp.]
MRAGYRLPRASAPSGSNGVTTWAQRPPRLKLFILHINSCEARGRTPITGKAQTRGAPALKTFDDLSAIGLREWIALPELGLSGLRAKIDTGAGTSALHASDIEPFQHEGEDWVRFTAHLGALMQRRRRCEAPLVAVKKIKSSNGLTQLRYMIRTDLTLGDRTWPVNFTLTCRKAMRYRVLLGAKALIDGQLVVNPALSYIQDKPVLANLEGES